MEYFSESNRPATIPQPETTKFLDEYQEVIGKDGKTELKKVGSTNVYEKIQEAMEGITLRELISKYQINIDDYDLTKMNEAVQDLTEMPTNLIDAMNLLNSTKDTFESAPEELRKVFNYNFNEFLVGSQNGTLKSVLSKYAKNETIETKQEEYQTEPQQTQTNVLGGQNMTSNNTQGVQL